MKTAICADLHLNNSNFGRMDKSGLSFRTKDFIAAFEFFVDQCINVVKPDRVVIIGDIYDNPDPQNPVRKFLNRMLKKLSRAGIKVEIIVGNHDSCYFSHALQPVEEAGFQNVRVFHAATLVEEDDCVMIFLPHTQEVERRETTHKMLIREFKASNAIHIAKLKVAGLPVLTFGHFGVYGVEMNDGILNHNKDDVSLEDLDCLDSDAIFLGHYHMDQALVVESQVPAMYVGSLERSTFNDKAKVKSFVVVETERGKHPLISRVEYPGARPMVTISGTADQIMAGIEKVKASMTPDSLEPIVKVKFSGTTSEYADFVKSRKGIRDELVGAKHIAFEKEVVDPDKEAKADAVKQQIAGKAEVGSSDILDIFSAYLKAAIEDETRHKTIYGMAFDIVSVIDDREKTSKGIVPGRTRIHGVKLQNFQMYGTDRNIVEFDKGCGQFFGRSWDGDGNDWSIVREDASVFLSSVSPEDRKLLSIVGKIDGDDNESNGAGKSSILDAISWAFYEKVIRDFFDKESSKGSSTTTVVRTIDDKPERECFVEVLFSSGNSLYLIRRERRFKSSGSHSGGVFLYCLYSPEGSSESGSMTGRRGADAEAFINQLVSMDFDTFSNSVMFGQSDADRFIRGTDKVKKEIFVKILGLTILDEYLKETRARKILIDKELASLEAQIQAMKANSMSQDQLDEAKTRSALLKENSEKRCATIAKIETEITVLRNDPVFVEKATLDSEIEVAKSVIDQRMDEARRASKTARESVASEETNLVSLKSDLKVVTQDLGKAQASQSSLESSIASFDVVACKKDIKYGEEARKAKPNRDAEKAELLARKEVVVTNVSQLNGIISSEKTRADKLKHSLSKLGDKDSIPCPECETPVSREHFEGKIAFADSYIAKFVKARDTENQPMAQILEKLAEVDKRLENIEEYTRKGEKAVAKLATHEANKAALAGTKSRTDEAMARQTKSTEAVQASESRLSVLKSNAKKYDDDAVRDTADASSKLAELNTKMVGVVLVKKARVEAAIEEAQRRIKSESAESTRMLSDASALDARIDVSLKMTDKIAISQATMLKKAEEQVNLGIIEDGFGLDGIRVQIIEKYIPLLNVYIGKFMDAMSDKMSVTVLTDGKRDGKMEIKIRGASASDPRQLSKGQFARIKVAVDLALGMMSLARNENAPDFVCLDEVFAPVDVNGKMAMLDVVKKLQEFFRMVIIISHDPFIQTMIKDTIVVNMINDTSTIEKQAWESSKHSN